MFYFPIRLFDIKVNSTGIGSSYMDILSSSLFLLLLILFCPVGMINVKHWLLTNQERRAKVEPFL